MMTLHEELSPLEIDLYRTLRTNGAMTRFEIVLLLDHPRTTIYDNLMKLVVKHLVRKFSRGTNERGRPYVFFTCVNAEVEL